MSILGKYDDLGIDPIIATELMGILGITVDDLSIPQRFERFKDVAQYIGKFENYPYLIKKLTIAKHVDKLDHMWEWCQLSKEKEHIDSEINSTYIEDDKIRELANDTAGIETLNKIQETLREKIVKSENIRNEMNLYE